MLIDIPVSIAVASALLPPDIPDQYEYSPARIRKLLHSWAETLALSETPSSARGLLVDGPTPETPRVGARQGGHHGDPLTYANVVADIERAWSRLTFQSLEWRTVDVLLQGHSLSAFAHVMGLRSDDVYAAFDRAVEAMASTLNRGEIMSFAPTEPRVCAAPDCQTLVRPHALFCTARCRLRTWRANKAGD